MRLTVVCERCPMLRPAVPQPRMPVGSTLTSRVPWARGHAGCTLGWLGCGMALVHAAPQLEPDRWRCSLCHHGGDRRAGRRPRGVEPSLAGRPASAVGTIVRQGVADALPGRCLSSIAAASSHANGVAARWFPTSLPAASIAAAPALPERLPPSRLGATWRDAHHRAAPDRAAPRPGTRRSSRRSPPSDPVNDGVARHHAAEPDRAKAPRCRCAPTSSPMSATNCARR